MNRKAQGISINTIIIAVIALIVLVVLVAIFTGRLGSFVKGVESCKDKGGTCLTSADAKCGEDESTLQGTDCKVADGKRVACCIPLQKPST